MKIHGTAKGGALGKKDFGVAFGASGTPAPTPDFESDYDNTSDWTKVGTKVTVDETVSDVGYFDNIENAAGDNNVSQALGLTLSDSLWYADFTFIINSFSSSGTGWLFLLTDSVNIPEVDDVDAIGVEILGDPDVRGYAINGNVSTATTSTVINLSVSTTYYARLERIDETNCRLNIYSDADRTTHITGSPQSWTVSSSTVSLDTILHAAADVGGGGRFTTATVDTTKIFNDATP